ncbi:MAG: helix-turn-helix transcriptional regulator [Gemella sp.]|nr:helix-turn-helix transcriptional regulator [Gemella sp.]
MNTAINVLAGKRVGAKITKKELAELLNISSQAYSKKESGVNPFKDYEMLKVYEYIKPYYTDLTIDYLFFWNKTD